ncbi:MAG: right-handed parallel beta-helix repeat-containing protein, partial [Planctomycetota bacterium]
VRRVTAKNLRNGIQLYGNGDVKQQAGSFVVDQCRFENIYYSLAMYYVENSNVTACDFANAYYHVYSYRVQNAVVDTCSFDNPLDEEKKIPSRYNDAPWSLAVYGMYGGTKVNHCRFRNLTYPIHCPGATYMDVTDVDITGLRYMGIYGNGKNLSVADAKVNSYIPEGRRWGGGYGVHLIDQEDKKPTLENVHVYGPYAGLLVRNRVPKFKKCSFKHCYIGVYAYWDAKKFDFAPRQGDCEITDNWIGIYCLSQEPVRIRNQTIRGNVYGLYGFYASDVTIENCEVTENYYGGWIAPSYYKNRHVDYNFDVTIRNCKFINNYHPEYKGNWGLACYGRQVTIENTEVSKNHYGLYVYSEFEKPVLKNLISTENYYYGLYHQGPLLELTGKDRVQISKCRYGIVAYGKETKLSDMTGPTECQWYGIYGRYGTMELDNVEIRNNGRGVFYYYGNSFIANRVNCHDNNSTGLYPHTVREAKITNCTLARNGNRGVIASAVENLQIDRCTFYPNRYGAMHVGGRRDREGNRYGTALVTNCVGLEGDGVMFLYYFKKAQMKGCKTVNGGWPHAIQTYYNEEVELTDCQTIGGYAGYYCYRDDKVRIKGCQAEKASSWGFYTYYVKDAAIDQCTARNNGGGFVSSPMMGPFQITNSVAENNSWGNFYIYRHPDTEDLPLIENCVADGCRYYNVYLNNVPVDKRTLRNVTIKNGSNYGLLAYRGDVDWDADLEVILTGNRYGLAGYYNKMRIRNTKLADNTYATLYSYRGSVEVRNATIEGQTHAMLTYGPSTVVANSRLRASSHAVHFHPYAESTPARLSVSNTSIENAYYPIYANGYSNVTKEINATVDIKNVRAKGTGRGYGLLAYYNKEVNAQDFDADNLYYGLYVYRSPAKVSDCQFTNMTSWGTVANSSPIDMARCDVQSRYGIYFYNSEDAKLTQCTSANSYYGLYCPRTKVAVQDSSLENIGYYGIYAYGDETDIRFDQSKLENVRLWGTVLYGGKFAANGSQLNSRYGLYLGNQQSRIVNSVIDGGYYGLYAWRPDSRHELLQSTVANTRYYGVLAYRGDFVVRNTILDAGYIGIYRATDAARITHDHNLISSPRPFVREQLAEGEVTNKKPIFVNAPARDFRLGKASPAINAGTDLSSLVQTDILGNKRPAYRAFEIGAYEYTDAGGSIRILDWDERAN